MKNSVKILAYAACAVLGCAGLILLFADPADDSPIVREIGWLMTFTLTKVAAVGMLWASYRIGR